MGKSRGWLLKKGRLEGKRLMGKDTAQVIVLKLIQENFNSLKLHILKKNPKKPEPIKKKNYKTMDFSFELKN